jgi:hypothetical protein
MVTRHPRLRRLQNLAIGSKGKVQQDKRLEKMKNMKHTRGNWEVKGLKVQILPNDPMNTITICQVFGSPTERENMANAKLIAAAPDLLEALNMMTSLVRIKYGNLDKDVYKEIQKAEAALTKATL